MSERVLREILTDIYAASESQDALKNYENGDPAALSHQIMVRYFRHLKENKDTPDPVQLDFALSLLEDELPLRIWKNGYAVWIEPEYEGATRCVAQSIQEAVIMAAGEVE